MDSIHIFEIAGLDFSIRFNKVLEVGADLYGGYSHAFFPNLDPAYGTIFSPNFLFGGGLHFTVSPFFNFAFEVRPAVRYYKSLGPFSGYDGLYFGIGASANLRLGTDPDAGTSLM